MVEKKVVSVTKTNSLILPPTFINYIDCRKYENKRVTAFSLAIPDETGVSFVHEPVQWQIFIKICSRHAPWKWKYIRGNNKLFMNKRTFKAFINWTCLWNNFKIKVLKVIKVSSKERNFCVSFLRKNKNKKIRGTTDRKKWWILSSLPCHEIKFREKS